MTKPKAERAAVKPKPGKPIKLKIEPLPVHAPWEVTPGGPELFAALKDVERRYARAARAHDADELLRVSARILSGLVLVMSCGNHKALTRMPKTRQSPNAWARAFLRHPATDTPQRASAAAEWLSKYAFVTKDTIFDGQLEGHEAVERFLGWIVKLRTLRNGNQDNELLSAHEQDAAALVSEAYAYFPRLFDSALWARENFDQWLTLVRHVAEKLSWGKDDESVMRAVLRACGMPASEVRALLNFQDWRIKSEKPSQG